MGPPPLNVLFFATNWREAKILRATLFWRCLCNIPATSCGTLEVAIFANQLLDTSRIPIKSHRTQRHHEASAAPKSVWEQNFYLQRSRMAKPIKTWPYASGCIKLQYFTWQNVKSKTLEGSSVYFSIQRLVPRKIFSAPAAVD